MKKNKEENCFVVKNDGKTFACKPSVKVGDKILDVNDKINIISSIEIDFGGVYIWYGKKERISFSKNNLKTTVINVIDKNNNSIKQPLLTVIGELPVKYFAQSGQKVTVIQKGCAYMGVDTADPEIYELGKKYRYLHVKCEFGCFHILNDEFL